jgi:hypothetical protein
MKLLISLLLFCCLAFTATACDTSTECSGDHCVCTDTGGCDFQCEPGGNECHIQGSAGPLDVQCAENEECHVECRGSSSCNVDCGGSTECHVTCPPQGCTVTDCVGADCVVSCGFGAATRNGSTATCP